MSLRSPSARLDRGSLTLGAAVLIILCGLGVAQTRAGQRVLDRAGLNGAHDGYTELAFAQPDALPRALEQVRSLRFVVRNAQGGRSDYRWIVELRSPLRRQQVRGSVSLASGEARTIAASVPPVCSKPGRGRERFTVQVRLQPTGQTIQFHAACGRI